MLPRHIAHSGEVWSEVGQRSGRADVAAHGAELLKIAPQLYHDLHSSMNKTANASASQAMHVTTIVPMVNPLLWVRISGVARNVLQWCTDR